MINEQPKKKSVLLPVCQLHAFDGHPYENTPAFSMKIGGTVYDVTTHWNTEGSQTVLQQFKELLLSHRTLETDI